MAKTSPAIPLRSPVTLLNSDQVVQRLGISKPTLYAYVSRGLLQAVADPADPRARRYSSFEVEQLQRRKQRGRRVEPQAKAALQGHWPVLETALTGIVDGAPVYRGEPVLALARGASVEDVARRLWQFEAADPFASPAPRLNAAWQRLTRELHAQPLSERTLALFAHANTQLHAPAWLPEGPALAQACGEQLRAAVACFLCQPPQAAPIATQFADAWGLRTSNNRAAEDALRQALVLCADHQMNWVSFSARGLASVGAGLGAALLGALCNLPAQFNGGSCAQVEALWDELLAAPHLETALRARLDRGEALPGFNHYDYPAGDPRATLLLKLAAQHAKEKKLPPIARLAERLTGAKPALDFGLVALRRALAAPPEAAAALLMAGRCVGILAHVLEQRRSGERLVARSRYVGP